MIDKDAPKRLKIAKETVRNLRVRTDLRAGLGALQTSTCPISKLQTQCACGTAP